MKDIQEIELKADAVMMMFENVINTIPHEYLKSFKQEIMEKSADPEKFADLNDDLSTALVEKCINIIYGGVVSKQKLNQLTDEIVAFIDDTLKQFIEDEEIFTERAIKYQHILVRHHNIMYNYAQVMIDNLADNIKINIK